MFTCGLSHERWWCPGQSQCPLRSHSSSHWNKPRLAERLLEPACSHLATLSQTCTRDSRPSKARPSRKHEGNIESSEGAPPCDVQQKVSVQRVRIAGWVYPTAPVAHAPERRGDVGRQLDLCLGRTEKGPDHNMEEKWSCCRYCG